MWKFNYHRIHPTQLSAKRLCVFWNPPWLIWPTPIWNSGKQTAKTEIGKRRTLWSHNYPRTMEIQMDTNQILLYCRWFWCRICWETTCGSLSHNPEEISQYHRRLGGQKILVLIWNGTMKKEHVEQLWMGTYWNSETNMAIWHLKNHNNHLTNTAQLIMALHSN